MWTSCESHTGVADGSELMRKELGINPADPTNPIPQLDAEFAETRLPDSLPVFHECSVHSLLHDTTMQLLVRLETMGDLSLGKGHTNRSAKACYLCCLLVVKSM